MAINVNNEMGKISIEENVIATIAGIAAMETYGIVGMASKNAKDGLFELLRMDHMSRGVSVYSTGDVMNIDLHVILQFGVRISTVCANIMESVKFAVENFTGIKVNKVNVLVQGIRVER